MREAERTSRACRRALVRRLQQQGYSLRARICVTKHVLGEKTCASEATLSDKKAGASTRAPGNFRNTKHSRNMVVNINPAIVEALQLKLPSMTPHHAIIRLSAHHLTPHDRPVQGEQQVFRFKISNAKRRLFISSEPSSS